MTAFWILAPIMVLSALGMQLVRKAVHAALLLAVIMMSLAVLYAALEAPFDTAGQELVTDWIAADRKAGKTVVIASHNLERAAPIADRAVLLARGQMTWQGAARDLPNVLARAS